MAMKEIRIETEVIRKRMFYQYRSCIHLSQGVQIYSITTIPNLNRLRPPRVRQTVVEVLEDTHGCFVDLISDIDKELAMNPRNELTEVLEYIQKVLRESLPSVEADLCRFGRNNHRL